MFRNRLFLAIVSGHFAVDVLNSVGPVLLAVLAVPLGLTNAQIGFALTLYLLSNSLLQPLFGWLSDRVQKQAVLLAGLGVVWVALFFCVIANLQSWPLLLVCFALAPLGSALFHPIGTAGSALAHPQRANSATAIFFFCGQMGLAAGPALGGILLDNAGSLGVLPLALFALFPAGLLILARNDGHQTTDAPPAQQPTAPQDTGHKPKSAGLWQWVWLTIGVFVLLVAVRASIQTAYQSFLPKLFADYGWDPIRYGLLAGTFMGASAVGNVVMGGLADRLGARMTTVVTLALSVPAGLACLAAPSLMITFAACALAGLLMGGQHSIFVVHAQRLLPTGRQFAAGLILGFTFASGAMGAWLVGIMADMVSLPTVMQVTTGFGGVAALMALTLPGRQTAAQREQSTLTSKTTTPEVLDSGSAMEPRNL